MKKFIGLILGCFLAFNSFGQAGVATASLQSAGNSLLNTIANYVGITQGATYNMANNVSSYTLTSAASSATSSGTVTIGAKFIIFETSSGFAGTIDGQTFGAGGFLCLPYTPYTSYPAIPYTVTSGTLIIRKFN